MLLMLCIIFEMCMLATEGSTRFPINVPKKITGVHLKCRIFNEKTVNLLNYDALLSEPAEQERKKISRIHHAFCSTVRTDGGFFSEA